MYNIFTMIIKNFRDLLIRSLCGSNFIPEKVLEAYKYFMQFGGINFEYKKVDKLIVAKSTNFRWGTIITSGRNPRELDKNIKDAILTSFSVPSVYANKLQIQKVDERQKKYALA
jgi:hypothetical protein